MKPGVLATDIGLNCRKALEILFAVMLCGFLLLQSSCDRKSSPASQQKTSGAPSTEAKLDSTAEPILEPNAAKRPLILSQPVPTAREWYIQVLTDGYHKTGRTNANWDAHVIKAFEAFADTTYNPTAYLPAQNMSSLCDAVKAATGAGCDDPLIEYLRLQCKMEIRPGDKKPEILKVHSRMLRSQYHPCFKYRAARDAAITGFDLARGTYDTQLVSWAAVCMEDFARDTNAPVNDAMNTAIEWIGLLTQKEWHQEVGSDLESIIMRNLGETELGLVFRGRMELCRAWDERGQESAAKVTDAGWKGFAEHTKAAEGLLTKAWQMNSNRAQTAFYLMRVELAQGKGRARMDQWFKQAMALDPKYYEAAKLMAYYLEPRWYGSESAALAFARTCVTSTNWGGRVPLVLEATHRSLAASYALSNSPSYWQRPQVWNDVKASYEKFFKLNPSVVSERHMYACHAYYCGQYETFLKQAQLFSEGTNQAFFGGPEKFQEMLQKATVATSGRPR
jgi:hypothetical protein